MSHLNKPATLLVRVTMGAILVMLLVVVGAGPALAHHFEVEVDAPGGSVVAGEDVELNVHVFDQETGEPGQGVAVVVYAGLEFAGSKSEYPMMRGVTDANGGVGFAHAWSQVGAHTLRVEVTGGNDSHPESVEITITESSQLRRTQPVLDLPGPGGVWVPILVAAAWAILAYVVFLMVRAEYSGGGGWDDPFQGRVEQRGLTISSLLLAFVVVAGAFLVIVLARSPNSRANLDPTGYVRTPIALVSQTAQYAGAGLADGVSAEGRTLFLVNGCAGCHGIDGRGAAVARGLTSVPRDWLGQAVYSGLGPDMPAYGGTVSDVDLDAIHAFLQESGLAKGGDAEGPATAPENPFTAPPSTIPTATAEGFGDVMAIVNTNCAVCHSGAGDGGYSIDTYDKLIAGGNSGAAVIPGNADGSHLIERLRGTSGLQMPPGSALSEADIAVIVNWINGGAVGPGASAGGSGGSDTFTAVSAVLQSGCAACHGLAGGFSVATYDSVINGGNTGIAVIAGDPDGSLLLQRMKGTAGGVMPPGGGLSDADIQLIQDWIATGAPNN